jgi:hypothetical protein
MEDFEEKEMMKFSWSGLFIVTSICSFLFSLVLKLIDGEHISLFIKIGFASLILASLSLVNSLLKQKDAKRRTKKVSPIFQED